MLIKDHTLLKPHRYNPDCLLKKGRYPIDCGVICHHTEYLPVERVGVVLKDAVQCDSADPDAPVHRPEEYVRRNGRLVPMTP